MSASLRRPPRLRARGFTIIELMIAMLLGLIVIGGVLGVVLIMLQTSRTNAALSEVQSGTRLAFELMAYDIRNARLTGCGNNGRVTNVLDKQGTAWWANWSNNVFIGYAGTQVDPAVAVGTKPADRLDGTDSLTVLSAADSAMSVNTHDPAGTFTVNGDIGNLRETGGDVLIVCDQDHAAIFQTASATKNSPPALSVLTYTATGGNCSLDLGFPGTCPGGGKPYTFRANSQIAPLSAADWYVGVSQANPPDGSYSLYRLALAYNNSTNTFVPTAQEIVRNVSATDGMTLSYLQSGATPIKFNTADKITDWAKVTAVQVTLTLQSSSQRAGADAQPLKRDYTATIALYNNLD